MQKGIKNQSKIDASKRHAKSIADAERHRRTPWTPTDESKSIRGKKSADIGDTSEEKDEKACRNHQNIIKMATKICPKSMKNRGCVADTFFERFGTPFFRFW